MNGADTFKGIIHGRVIELEESPNLPSGQLVMVVLHPANGGTRLAPGEGLRRSAGAWADDPVALDQYRQEARRSRQQQRRELEL